MRRNDAFFHLQEQGIVVAVSEQKNQVGSGAHRSYAHDAMTHISYLIAGEHVAPFA